MAKITLNDVLDSINPEINNILSTDYREVLDKRITILDLSYEALKVNVYRNTAAHIEAYNSAYRILVEVLDEKASRQYSSLEQLPSGYFDNPRAPYVYINGGDNNRFLVAQSFDSIRNFITNNISRHPRLVKTSFGQTTLYKNKLNKQGMPSGDVSKTTRTKVDIGHIASAENEQLTSPLELKLSNILELGRTTDNPIIISEAQRALSDLYAIQAEASYSFKNTTPEAISLAQNKLGSLYVVVTLHRQKLNKAFSEKELAIFNRLKVSIALKLSKTKFQDISGSNTIVEDIAQHLRNTLAGNKKKLTKHDSHSVKADPIKVSGKVKTEAKGVKVNKPKLEQTSLPQQQVSLISLQSLINTHLQDVVSANMGDGSRRDILNYRTGRFASTVKVERLSLSREGMITAFYSFMKNPYATFSQGGRQSIPTSRDPKLLIAKSIREIAAEQVGNRMRSVAV
jgi:hypothetical protein